MANGELWMRNWLRALRQRRLTAAHLSAALAQFTIQNFTIHYSELAQPLAPSPLTFDVLGRVALHCFHGAAF